MVKTDCADSWHRRYENQSDAESPVPGERIKSPGTFCIFVRPAAAWSAAERSITGLPGNNAAQSDAVPEETPVISSKVLGV